jgi:hypothetical protein
MIEKNEIMANSIPIQSYDDFLIVSVEQDW